MGRKQCCYKSCCPPFPCCPPCPPCIPPCIPSCLPPCGPCFPPCCPQPCNEWFAPDCCDTYSCNKQVDFLGQSTDELEIMNLYTPILFTEVKDCGSNYNNNSIFNPNCKGKYKICAAVPILINSILNTAQIQLVTSSGVVKASSNIIDGSENPVYGTLNIDTIVCLGKCESVYIRFVGTGELSTLIVSPSSAPRTFSGYSVNNSCC